MKRVREGQMIVQKRMRSFKKKFENKPVLSSIRVFPALFAPVANKPKRSTRCDGIEND